MKKLSSGKWLWMLLCCILLILLLVMGFNFVTDPYGAFGDRVLQWWSYDETMNPKLAKISYLEQHHDEYDSYIIGASGSSSLPVAELNERLNAKFYNCFFYGADMEAYEQMCRYFLEHYEVKNILLNLSPQVAITGESMSEDNLSYHGHYKITGESPVTFYGRYLLANPMDGVQKLRSRATDGFLPEAYKCFDGATGAYDKRWRDAEGISDLDAYLADERYTVFRDYPQKTETLHAVDRVAAAVQRIRDDCAAHGVNLTVLCQPAYYENLNFFSQEDLAAFRNALAGVTDYWDFSLSAASYEPRYFYDETHFRNDVGRMMLARIFGDADVYLPEGFGEFIPQGTAPGAPAGAPADPAAYTCRVPILMYHHLTEEPESTADTTVPVTLFRAHMEALRDAGYHAVSFEQLRDYVWKGTALPEKPFAITFDDGYESNYTLAYPVLKDCGFSAAVYVIGVSVGKDTYKDTGVAMTPHFSLEQAEDMADLVTIGSHGFNFHEVEGRDPAPIRRGVLQREGETEAQYVAFLREDCRQMETLLGRCPGILAYPYGEYSQHSEIIMLENGIWSTVTIEERTNTLVKGLQQSLRQMGRYAVTPAMTAADVLSRVAP